MNGGEIVPENRMINVTLKIKGSVNNWEMAYNLDLPNKYRAIP